MNQFAGSEINLPENEELDPESITWNKNDLEAFNKNQSQQIKRIKSRISKKTSPVKKSDSQTDP
jgi:hypothetical protein